MSLNSFSNSISWLPITCSKSTLILTYYKFYLEPKLILVNCSSSMTVHRAMQRFWTLIRASISSISISSTSSWKNVSGKCCWIILGGIVILTCHISTSLRSILWGNFCPSTSGSTRWLCLKAQMLPMKDECECMSSY